MLTSLYRLSKRQDFQRQRAKNIFKVQKVWRCKKFHFLVTVQIKLSCFKSMTIPFPFLCPPPLQGEEGGMVPLELE